MIAGLWIEPPMSEEQTAGLVTGDELLTAAAFGSERRRREFLTWRAMVRRELGRDVRIGYNQTGAPVLLNRDLSLSVAHCAGRVAVCISENPCAIDIEPESRDFERVAAKYLTPVERALSAAPLWPGVVWCAKETLYKYAGRGELDFLRDLGICSADLAAGRLMGRIGDAESIPLRCDCSDGFICVYIR